MDPVPGKSLSIPAARCLRPQGSMMRALLALMLCVAAAAEADTWRWRDADGNLNFGDTPPEGVAAERVQVIPPRPRMSPEEAEESVRRLREEAEVQMREAEAGRRADAERAASAAEAGQQALSRCEGAKRALTMLRMERPVYEDDEGGYRIKRPPGQGDAYTGGRRYLDDAERAAAIEAQEAIIAETCATPYNEGEEQRVADQLRESEACESAAAELAEGEGDGLRLAPADRERLEQFLREECGAR